MCKFNRKGVILVNRKYFILLLIIALLLVMVAGCNTDKNNEPLEQETPSQEEENNQKNYAPEFELENLDGDVVKLSDFKGKKVFINFWATWCPYCVDEMPDLNKLYNKYKDDDFVILAINVGESKDKAQKFAEEYNLDFIVLLDSTNEVAGIYGARSLPTTVAIDEEGVAVVGKIGMLKYDDMENMYSYFDDQND